MIREDLEADGFSCWMASRDILGSADYLEVLPQAIESAKVFLLVLSAQAMASDHVYREVHAAADAKLPILPVRIDTANIEGRLVRSPRAVDRCLVYRARARPHRHDLRYSRSAAHRRFIVASAEILRLVTFAAAWMLITGNSRRRRDRWFNFVPQVRLCVSRYARGGAAADSPCHRSNMSHSSCATCENG
jgi:hypothetical protein